MPGRPHICSSTTVPPSAKAKFMPIRLTTGIMAFLRACLLSMARSTSPFALAVRM